MTTETELPVTSPNELPGKGSSDLLNPVYIYQCHII